MDRRREIRAWCQRVGKKFGAERIILFGSRAAGSATEESDADLLVVLPLKKGERAAHKAAEIRQQVEAGFPMDLIVHSPAEMNRRISAKDGFIRDVLENGVTVYEAKHS